MSALTLKKYRRRELKAFIRFSSRTVQGLSVRRARLFGRHASTFSREAQPSISAYWFYYREAYEGKIVGRVAAIINP